MTIATHSSESSIEPQGHSAVVFPPAADSLAFRLFCLNRDFFALSLLKHRSFQGFLITGPHSGTHWIKWMLSNALAHRYGVAPPRYYNNASSNDLVGHPKHKSLYPEVPRIASTHSVAPYALQSRLLRKSVRFPPYVVVVRDIHDVLISHYEKWRQHYNIPFSQFLKGDPGKRGFIIDVWQYVRFMNRWGAVATRFPQETLVLKYEDFRADKLSALARMARHFNLDLSDADIAAGAAVGDKAVMERHRDPSIEENAVRPDGQGDTVFSAEDNAVLNGILERHLRHDFGYPYFSAPRGFRP